MASRTPTDLSRRAIVAAAGLFALTGAGLTLAKAGVPVEVWKDPSCGCCKDWIAHLEANGFQVKVHETGNNAVRAQLGIDPKYGSCHTAVVGGYAIEGHVPAKDIQRLLQDKPAALGLAVPGMIVGTPGMDGPTYKGRRDSFDVLLLARGDGGASVFRHYEGNGKK